MTALLQHPGTLDVWLCNALPGHWVRERVYEEDVEVFIASGLVPGPPVTAPPEHLARYTVVVRARFGD